VKSTRAIVSTACVLAALLVTATAAVARGTDGAQARADVTLTVWDWSSPPPAAMKELDDAFMKQNPDIAIKRVHQPFNSYFTLLRTAVATRKGPDVFEGYATPFMFDYLNGMLPLTKYRTAAQKKDLVGWAGLSANLNANDTPYAMPWTGQGINMYYNKALFKKAGLDPNAPPKTWAQFLAACAALKKAGIIPITAGWKDGYYAEWWVDVLAAQYMTPAQLASSGVNSNWQSPAIAKSFTRLIELSDKGYMTPNAEAIPLFPDVVNNFGAGKGAFFMGLSANNANYSEFAKAKIAKDLGAMLPPVLPDAVNKKVGFDYGPGLSWAITKWSKNPDAAYKFLTFLGSPKAQQMIFKSAGTIPNNLRAKVTTPDKVGTEILGWLQDYPLYVGQVTLIRANVEPPFDKVVPQIMTKKLSIADGMKQVQDAQKKATKIPTK
jgi:ABC-type glycerol-3-phosphate transport system substrate-binding protein